MFVSRWSEVPELILWCPFGPLLVPEPLPSHGSTGTVFW